MAKILREWGVRGEMKALPLSEKFSLLRPNDSVCLRLNDDIQKLSIKSLRALGNFFAVSFNEISGREAAALCRGAILSCPAVSRELREGEFFYDQIIGLSVVSAAGDKIGAVADIFETGAHDIYVVKNGQKEYLIPAVKEFIIDIKLNEKTIIVNEMKGLLE